MAKKTVSKGYKPPAGEAGELRAPYYERRTALRKGKLSDPGKEDLLVTNRLVEVTEEELDAATREAESRKAYEIMASVEEKDRVKAEYGKLTMCEAHACYVFVQHFGEATLQAVADKVKDCLIKNTPPTHVTNEACMRAHALLASLGTDVTKALKKSIGITNR